VVYFVYVCYIGFNILLPLCINYLVGLMVVDTGLSLHGEALSTGVEL